MERDFDRNERVQGRPHPSGGHGFPGPFEEAEERVRHAGGPTWRALFLAVVAAIVLSVSATLLLGGSFGSAEIAPSTGRPTGNVCCPPAGR